MQLKHVVLSIAVLGAFAIPLTASGNKKPVTQWTCSEFLAVDEQFRPKVIYAATAYSKMGKPAGEVVDIEGTEKVTPMVIAACQKTPQASFWETLKNEWQKLEAKLK